MAEARAAHGPASVLVNCAGIGTAGRVVGRDGPLRLEAFDRVIRVNLIGTFNMIRLAAVAMSALEPIEDDERGVIINTASIAAFDGQVGQAAYAASKGGVVGMTLPIARELARAGVRVMTIAPGVFHTPMVAGLPPEIQAKPGRRRAVSSPVGDGGGIRGAGRTYRRQSVSEWGSDPVGWVVAHGAEVRLAWRSLSGIVVP